MEVGRGSIQRDGWPPCQGSGSFVLGQLVTLALAGGCFLLPLRSSVADELQSARDLLAEYSEGLSRIEGSYSTVTVSGKLTTESDIGTPKYAKKSESLTLKRKKSGMMQFIVDLAGEMGQDGSPQRRVGSSNGIYLFLVGRDANSGKDYRLVDFDSAETRKSVSLFRRRFSFIDYLYSAPNACPIRRLIQDPGFTLKGSSWSDHHGVKMIKFEFEYKFKVGSSEKDYSLSRLRSGYFIVSRDEGWALHEAGLVLTNPGQQDFFTPSVTIEYDRSIDGIPVPRRVINVLSSSRFTFDVDRIDFAEPRNADFNLASFGLPEPATGTTAAKSSGPGATTLWLFLSALAMLFGAVAVKYYASRLAARSAPAR